MRFYQFISLIVLGIAGLALGVGCGGGSSTSMTPIPSRVELVPACGNPSPIGGTANPNIRSYFVIFAEGTTSAQAVEYSAFLAAKYGFTPDSVYETVLKGFAATLTPEQVAKLRCETMVASLEYNQLGGTIGGTGT